VCQSTVRGDFVRMLRQTDEMRLLILVAVILVANVLVVSTSSAGGAGGAGGAVTGLRGSVVRGPTMPVCHEGTPCTAPAADVMLAFRRDGHIVRTRTDTRGRYRVLLTPGAWALSLPHGGIERLTPQRVLVVVGRVRVVDLEIDTGIR
jgi:hypothetical protein